MFLVGTKFRAHKMCGAAGCLQGALNDAKRTKVKGRHGLTGKMNISNWEAYSVRTEPLVWQEGGYHSPMNEHSAASVNVSGWNPNCAEILPPSLPATQALLNKGIALGKPFNEIFPFKIIDRDVQVFVALDKRRVIGELPVYDGENVCDFAVGQGLWTSE